MKYKAKDTICSFCSKQFVSMNEANEYDFTINIDGVECPGWFDICPGCNKLMDVLEGRDYGIDPDTIPEDKIKRYFHLR